MIPVLLFKVFTSAKLISFPCWPRTLETLWNMKGSFIHGLCCSEREEYFVNCCMNVASCCGHSLRWNSDFCQVWRETCLFQSHWWLWNIKFWLWLSPSFKIYITHCQHLNFHCFFLYCQSVKKSSWPYFLLLFWLNFPQD